MSSFMKKEFPWFVSNAVWFWCVPLIGGYLDSDVQTGFYLLLMMIVNPFVSMLISVFYGIKRGRKWIYMVYPTVCSFISMFMYYNSSAFAFICLTILCSFIGFLLGSWARSRRMSEAEKWSEQSGLPLNHFKDEKKTVPVQNSENVPVKIAERHGPSKTALKNQQKAYARKAKERAEKEAKIREKNAPKKG